MKRNLSEDASTDFMLKVLIVRIIEINSPLDEGESTNELYHLMVIGPFLGLFENH